MIRINLLPHRELKRKAQQQQIAVLAGIIGFFGIAAIWIINSMIAGAIDYQNGRNQYLSDQIAILDKEIAEIQNIKASTNELLARKQIVESLQNSRSEVVHLMDQLARLIPDGVYLQSLKQVNDDINLIGFAQSNAWVSTLMRNLESSPYLESALLIEIKATTVNNARQNEFNMKVKLTNATSEDIHAEEM
ncbi:MAG: fimbrial protein [Nitrosomonas sp.]|nr:MAG: fimbrial protein [Nitrosomonas sp.]